MRQQDRLRVGAGVFEDFSIAKRSAEYVEPMEPVAADSERYTEYFQLYRQIYRHLQSDFGELARLMDGERPAV